MPPRKSRRLLGLSHEDNIIEDATAEGNTEENVPPIPRSALDPNAGLPILRLPVELFDAIIENYAILPSTHTINIASNFPHAKYYERNDALTALSQTCTALRDITLPRLWERLDMSRVPERARGGTSLKCVMQAMERKANGIAVSRVRHYVRTLTILFTKSQSDEPLAALWAMLPKLPNLRTIHILVCKIPYITKLFTGSWHLELPNVTALFIPGDASILQRVCPNATHVRCTGGNGGTLISGLTDKTEVFDGVVDWMNLPNLGLVDRLVEKAPNLRRLELKRPDTWPRYDDVPAAWKEIIPKLAPLKKLVELILTFPSAEDKPGNAALIERARTLMRNKPAVAGGRRLILRHVVAPRYSDYGKADVMTSCVTETFE
ncbi:hypothetical protein K438DRAFT_1932977 [Mycena galopus ATCC 62051]|nr:hypothetical protein K438DRAFT_1932977 [Mycena galopus ATCC 62051]